MSLQIIETGRVAAIDMIYSSEGAVSVYLAVAPYGLEVMSSVWNLRPSGKFELLKDILTVGMRFLIISLVISSFKFMFCLGATDVVFTKSDGDLYLTIAQVFYSFISFISLPYLPTIEMNFV